MEDHGAVAPFTLGTSGAWTADAGSVDSRPERTPWLASAPVRTGEQGMAHDPVVAETTRDRDSLEPRFVLPDQEARAAAVLDGLPRPGRPATERPGRPLRRRGLGRLRLLRRGRGRRGPHPQHRPAGPTGQAADLLLLGAVVHAVAGVDHDRPPAHAPRAAPSAHVRPARRPRRRGHPRRAARRAGYVTQAVGKWHIGRERRVPTPERRLRRLLRLPVGVGHVHRVARPQLLPRDRLQRGADQVGGEPALQQVLRPRHPGRGDRERRGGDRPGALAAGRQVGRLLPRLHPADGRARAGRAAAVVPLPLHPGRPLRQLPPRAVPRLLAGQAPLQGHHHRAGRHRGPPGRRAGGDRAAGGHPHLPLLGQRARDGDLARRRLLPVPERQGLDLGGGPAGAGHRGVARDDRRRPGHRRALLPDGPVQHRAWPWPEPTTRCPRTATSTGSTRPRSCSTPRASPTASTSTTG